MLTGSNKLIKSGVYLLLMGGFLGLWLWLGPVVVGLGIWSEASGATSGTDEYVLATLNMVYLLLSNGVWCVGILGAAVLCGLGVLGIGGQFSDTDDPLSVRHNATRVILVALGVGLAVLSLVVLGFGVLGIMGRGVFLAVLVVAGLSGVSAAVKLAKQWRGGVGQVEGAESGAGYRIALLMIPLVALGVLAVMAPAGVLWGHDGRGFDVLEYHLQLPREYMQLGHIGALDHNVYSSFPANAEMLYLLGMVLKGEAIEGMYLGQMLNLGLGVAVVWGIYVMFRRVSKVGAAVAAVLAAGPQLFYVATNAYVECYMLLMFVLAVGCTPVMWQGGGGAGLRRWWLWVGIFTGAACGAKYTSLVMVVPVVLLFVLAGKAKLKSMALVLVTALVTFSPWLIKNCVMRGNPLFPLAARQLGQDGWTEEQVDRWDKAHAASDEKTSVSARVRATVSQLVDPRQYGSVVIVGVMLLLLAGKKGFRDRQLICIGAMGVQVVAWAVMTHLQGRFLLPMVVPAAVLIVGAYGASVRAQRSWGVRVKGSLVLVLVVGAILGHTLICAVAYNDSTAGIGSRYGFAPVAGRDDLIKSGYPFGDSSDEIAVQSKVLLVGESRPFYVGSSYEYTTVFDRCQLAEKLTEGVGVREILSWLRETGFTHVYVNWAEVARLQKYYGFAGAVNRGNLSRLEAAGLVRAEQGKLTRREDATVLYRVVGINHKK